MTIEAVEVVPLAAELSRPFRFGGVTRTASANVVVRVVNHDGLVGHGEACPVPQLTGETQESVVALLDQRAMPVMRGRSERHWRPLIAELRTRLYGAPFSLAALDTALLDLAGKAADLPVAEILGGRRRGAVELHGSVGWSEDVDEMAAVAAEQAELFETLKVYLGPGTLADDLDRLAAVRERIGGGRPIIVDVNGMWTPVAALSAAPRLVDLGVVAIEQPLPAGNRLGMAEVCRAFGSHGLVLVADESVLSVHDVVGVATLGLARAVNVGMSKLGGVVTALDAATVAGAAGLQVVVGSVVELGIATAAGLHLAAVVPELSLPTYLMGPLKYSRQVTTPLLEPVQGHVTVPDAPGLGIEIDEVALAALDVRRRRAAAGDGTSETVP